MLIALWHSSESAIDWQVVNKVEKKIRWNGKSLKIFKKNKSFSEDKYVT